MGRQQLQGPYEQSHAVRPQPPTNSTAGAGEPPGTFGECCSQVDNCYDCVDATCQFDVTNKCFLPTFGFDKYPPPHSPHTVFALKPLAEATLPPFAWLARTIAHSTYGPSPRSPKGDIFSLLRSNRSFWTSHFRMARPLLFHRFLLRNTPGHAVLHRPALTSQDGDCFGCLKSLGPYQPCKYNSATNECKPVDQNGPGETLPSVACSCESNKNVQEFPLLHVMTAQKSKRGLSPSSLNIAQHVVQGMCVC